jgi:hypothetical protein
MTDPMLTVSTQIAKHLIRQQEKLDREMEAKAARFFRRTPAAARTPDGSSSRERP